MFYRPCNAETLAARPRPEWDMEMGYGKALFFCTRLSATNTSRSLAAVTQISQRFRRPRTRRRSLIISLVTTQTRVFGEIDVVPLTVHVLTLLPAVSINVG